MVADAWTAESPTRSGTARAREKYLTGERLDPAAPVRDSVLASWQRCRGLGTDPSGGDLPYAPEREPYEQLLAAADPVLTRLQQTLAWTRISVLLTDPAARVLDRRVGEPALRRHLDAVQLAPGFGYAEDAAGTNGIGTCLAEGRPITVHSGEHFTDRLQPFACAAAPVRDPLTGDIQGILDLTCWQSDAHPMMLRLLRGAVRGIEELLYLQHGEEQRELAAAGAVRSRWAAGAGGSRGTAGTVGGAPVAGAGGALADTELEALVDGAAVLLAAGRGGASGVPLGRAGTAQLLCRPARHGTAQPGRGPGTEPGLRREWDSAGFAVEAVAPPRRNDSRPDPLPHRPATAHPDVFPQYARPSPETPGETPTSSGGTGSTRPTRAHLEPRTASSEPPDSPQDKPNPPHPEADPALGADEAPKSRRDKPNRPRPEADPTLGADQAPPAHARTNTRPVDDTTTRNGPSTNPHMTANTTSRPEADAPEASDLRPGAATPTGPTANPRPAAGATTRAGIWARLRRLAEAAEAHTGADLPVRSSRDADSPAPSPAAPGTSEGPRAEAPTAGGSPTAPLPVPLPSPPAPLESPSSALHGVVLVGDARAGRLVVAARRRLALLREAGVAIGRTLDVARTAEELAAFAVPRLAHHAVVDLCEWVLSVEDPPPPPERPSPSGPLPQVRRVALRTLLDSPPERWVGARVQPSLSEPTDPRAACLYRRQPVLAPICAGAGAAPDSGADHTLSVPLLSGGRLLGVVTLHRPAGADAFGEDDVALVQELAARTALCLDNARRAARERALALTLQHSLLPGALPRQRAMEFAHRYLPAPNGVGGDWYDVIPLSGARVALAVGDVVGHGLHAAATMGRLRTAIRNFSTLDLPAEELLGHLDALVDSWDRETGGGDACGAGGVLGATCLYAVYDPVSRICTLAGAGHPRPLLLLPDGGAEFLELPQGPPLGLGGSPFEAVERELPEGSQLVLYTNGLLGCREQDVDTGLERLRSALSGHPERLPEQICAAALTELLPCRPRDDVALLVARPRPLDACHVASWEVPLDPAEVSALRSAVARQLARWGLEELVFTTELIVSELITNAIRYTAGPAQLRLLRDQSLICEVADSTSTSPRLRRARGTDEGGRGLFLVAQLAHRWGTRYTRTGKVIWAEQPLPPGAADRQD
jgi:serine phosphatase RsbU (regulator of sigma subunit)/anti-sigma regulatory factor (Ser/Thr protein kinase)